jgi:hypothetical protein
MVQRYAHLSPDHMLAAVERLAAGGQTGRGIRDQQVVGLEASLAKCAISDGDPGGIRTRDLDLERVASLARLDDGVPGPTARKDSGMIAGRPRRDNRTAARAGPRRPPPAIGD